MATLDGKRKKVKKVSELKKHPLSNKKPTITKKTRRSIVKLGVNSKLKNKPFGSNSRRVAYKKLNFKQDHTTTGYKTVKSKIKSGKIVSSSSKSPSVSAITYKPKATKVISERKTRKLSKLRSKGEAALVKGNVRKARRLRKRYDRKQKRK